MIQLLEKKIIPKKQKEIRIQIGNINTTATTTTTQPIIREKQNIENKEQQNETKEQENINEPIEKTQVNPIKMTDKTKTTNIDRNRIMERLNQQNLLLVKPNVFLPMIREQEPEIEREKTTEIIPTTIQPLKIKRKVVIKKPVQKEKETVPPPPPPPQQFEELPIQEAVPELPPPPTEEVATKKKRQPRIPKAKKGEMEKGVSDIDLKKAKINGMNVIDRLPEDKQKIIIKPPSFYMNNRMIFIDKLRSLFSPYRNEVLSNNETVSCNTQSNTTDFELMTHQKVARDYLNLYTPYRGLLLYFGLGSGKCLKKDTPILMYDGSIKMVQDIEIDDQLMGDDSKPRTILSLAQGRDRMYDIIPSIGNKYTVNEVHILCLKAEGFPNMIENESKFKIEWIENNTFHSRTFDQECKNEAFSFFDSVPKNNIIEIEVVDYLKLPDDKKKLLKGYKVPVDFEEKQIPIDPYFIGVWITQIHNKCTNISCMDFEILFHIRNILDDDLKLVHKNNFNFVIHDTNTNDTSHRFLQIIKDFNLIDSKNIPFLYKCNSRQNRLKLLAGIIDSIGIYNNKMNYYEIYFPSKLNNNPKLKNDILFLLESLGFYNSLENDYSEKIIIQGHGIYEIPTQKPNILKTQKDVFIDNNENVFTTDIQVEYVGEDEYYGFMIDENCRFLLGDMTVTHNTCTSIAIAEGMKTNKRVFVMTPASLKMNFFTEMKKCGDELYKKNQHWEFIAIEGNPEYVGILSRSLSLPVEYIMRNGGAWLVNIKENANYTKLSSEKQKLIDEQLNEMIRSKYTDINYNGLNMKKIDAMTENKTKNPFNNSVVIIDEAHNFVSRIVNKLKKEKSISHILYDYLMSAENAKIVLMSGTPIINYPNEIAIMYNILRGYIKTWTLNLEIATTRKVSTQTIVQMFYDANFRTYDYIEYNSNKLIITRNPFGFINAIKPGVAKGTVRGPRVKKGGDDNNENNINLKTKKQKNKILKNNKTKKISKINLKIKKPKTDKQEQKQRQSEPTEEITEQLEKEYRKLDQFPYDGGEPNILDKYNGVHLDDTGNISDEVFIKTVIDILNKNGINIIALNGVKVDNYKLLPDDPETFNNIFIDTDEGKTKNIGVFQRRILGLTSYYRSAQEKLLPKYVKTDDGNIYHVVKSEMSSHQFAEYEKIRKEERDREKSLRKRRLMNKGDELFNTSSSYRIFSRAACNFIFPDGIERPMPIMKIKNVEGEGEGEEMDIGEIDERDFDIAPKRITDETDISKDFGEEDDAELKPEETTYLKRIEKALEDVSVKIPGSNESQYLELNALQELSPKFAKIVENLNDENNIGLHLLYSHFRTIEGIGILKLILLANGFSEFKIEKVENTWKIVGEDDQLVLDKPRFVLYTGTETTEEKEIIRNIYNGAWDYVPISISAILKEKYENNMYGEVIKLFMITSSGAEGINLKNTRFVHIVEPYWHMVRVEQVVGRARRICSHEELPEEYRNVKVFLYMTVLSNQQKTDEKNIELKLNDKSRIDGRPITTDESLYEIAVIKERINNQLLTSMKETAIDCNLYTIDNNTNGDKVDDEPLVCYNFETSNIKNQFGSFPTLEKDKEMENRLNIEEIQWEAVMVSIAGVDYALNQDTMELYDLNSYNRSKTSGVKPILIGRLILENGQYKIIRNV
jgi:hypothetical protein